MAYSGSTAGSTVANPPSRGQTMLAGSTNTGSSDATAWSQWLYRSTHTQQEIAAAGFFTDAQVLGISVGDSVLGVKGTTAISHHVVTAVTSTGASLSEGLLVSSAS